MSGDHSEMLDKLHSMGATRIVLGPDTVEVEFPIRPIIYDGPKAVEPEMTEEERAQEELRMALLGTEEGT